jgi:SWI/SNF-related matrix-associated actin-dependent regulator of chromatin subfamily A3
LIFIIKAIRETISRATKEKEAIVRVQISVYGPRATARAIGKHLSEQKIYLQRPDYIRDGADYDNPHVLKLEDHQFPVAEPFLDSEKNLVEHEGNIDTLKKTVTEVYSSLTRDHNLVGLEGDERLRTRLLL